MGAKVKDWHLFYNYLNGPSSATPINPDSNEDS